MPVNNRSNEDGFTMIVTMIGLSLIAILVMVAVTSVNGDVHLTGRDLDQKRAYDAAQAGINEYAFHLHINNGYWAECTKPPAPSAGTTNALNQQGHTDNRRAVPGDPGAAYAIELIPATGQKACDPTNITTATTSMLESLGTTMKGTFRIRATGFVGKAQTSITATFKPASFLDYVYFTQLETSDPVTYGTNELIEAAYKQCDKTIKNGRTEAEILPNKGYCKVISFVKGDEINGPLHTNDAMVICNNPTFGRSPNDQIEVSAATPGWYSTNTKMLHSGSSCSGSPKFVGTYRTKSPPLIPPATNSKLAQIAEPAFKYKGQVRICLSGAEMTVNSGNSCTEVGKVLYKGPLPANGVVYVEASGPCSSAYTPFGVTYPAGPSECGNAYIQGSYTGQLTIAAANDIIINGSVVKTSETGILGLIANNFIRIYHPVPVIPATKTEPEKTECKNATGSLENLTVDAAILALNHSFIVDNYECGASLGKLTIHGAISQKYRGAVGTTNGTGYIKNYEYDDRLHTIAPPSFLQPVQADWVIGRETVG